MRNTSVVEAGMIRYKVNAPVAVEQFIDVLLRSTLGERCPIDEHECYDLSGLDKFYDLAEG
ncbi:MAG: hypothetical protein JG718_04720 [Candidatus Thiothrix moscowensis]|nr:hypothetical protein [Candidatus Thiothrix moscowensis]